MQQIILHIDFDSFFASVEQQYDVALRNKPIGVTAHNGRTCIIAASREAKRLGVKTAMNTREAFHLCPTLLLVRADFEKYFEVSKKFVRICKDFSPYVELFSIDELFIDISLTAKLFGGTDVLITKLKKRINDEIGAYITVSIGVSHNKLLAKLGSGLKKPNGIVKITEENLHDVFADAALTDICGIGGRINLRLNAMGVYTLLQLGKVPLRNLVAEFGNVEGHFLHNVGQGVDTDRVKPYTQAPDAKSVSRQYCLPDNQYDERIVFQNIYELCEELAIKLRRLEKKTRHVGISLHGSHDIGGHLLLHEYTSNGKDIFYYCRDIVWKFLREYESLTRPFLDSHVTTDHTLHIPGYVRRIGVWVGDLENARAIPESLFSELKKNKKLDETVDKLNDKYGAYTVRNGFLLHAKKLKTVPNGFMGDRFERVKLATEF